MRPGPWLLALSVSGGAWLLPRAAAATATAPSDDAHDQAVAQVKKARRAADRGDWKTALGHFEEAMRLKPSPKLHYSIAVCHHRLALTLKEDSEERKANEVAAIDSYQRHLDENPDAANRDQVKQTIAALGGDAGSKGGVGRIPGGDTPTDDPWAEFEDEPAEPAPEATAPTPGAEEPAETPTEEPVPELTPEPPPTKGPVPTHGKARPEPRGPRARIGGAFTTTILHPVDAFRSDRMDVPFGAGLLLHGGAYLGQRRQLTVGGEIGLSGGIPIQLDRHGLLLAHAGITVDYGWVLGRSRRFEITLGALVGLAFESMRTRRPPAREVTCPASEGREVSQRAGLLGILRPGVWVLLGQRRNHMIGLRVGPGMMVMAEGSAGKQDRDGDDCDAPEPFREAGLPEGFGFGVLSDLGYAIRF